MIANRAGPKKTIEMPDSLVAFGDVLGISAASFHQQRRIDFANRLVRAHKMFNDRVGRMPDVTEINVKFFSDSIIMSGRIDGIDAIALVLNNMAFAQAVCALNGLFLRGAIEVGPHLSNGTVDFGPALTEAVRQEKARSGNSAKITLSKEIITQSKGAQLGTIEDPRDGTVFLDFMGQIKTDSDIKTLRANIVSEIKYLTEVKAHIFAKDKLIWLARYFNWHFRSIEPIEIDKREFVRR